MNNKLLILGAGGHGKVVADIALKMGNWDTIYFLDDDKSKNEVMGIKCIGRIEDSYKMTDEFDVFIAIGDNLIRKKLQTALEKEGASIPSLIHPLAVVGMDVKIDAGTVVMAGVIINCCTTIGRGCIINTNSSLDHDNFICDYVHISPGSILSGNVSVGKETWICSGSIISNNVSIAENCIVGAGSVVIKNIFEKGTYVGVPARIISRGYREG